MIPREPTRHGHCHIGARLGTAAHSIAPVVDAGSERGSGFSFNDIAADRAGIRFAETVTAADSQTLADLSALASSEAAFMPSIDGLDSQMSEAEL